MRGGGGNGCQGELEVIMNMAVATEDSTCHPLCLFLREVFDGKVFSVVKPTEQCTGNFLNL